MLMPLQMDCFRNIIVYVILGKRMIILPLFIALKREAKQPSRRIKNRGQKIEVDKKVAKSGQILAIEEIKYP